MKSQNQWFKLTVTLTNSGSSKFRADGISSLGSDKALAGFQSLLNKKHGLQAASPADFKTQEFKVRDDDISRVMGDLPKMLRLGWAHIASVAISEIAGSLESSPTKFSCVDCNGSALQFTGSGRSVQCADEAADLFDTQAEAEAALKLAEERGGQVVPQHDPCNK